MNPANITLFIEEARRISLPLENDLHFPPLAAISRWIVIENHTHGQQASLAVKVNVGSSMKPLGRHFQIKPTFDFSGNVAVF